MIMSAADETNFSYFVDSTFRVVCDLMTSKV